MIDKIKEKPIKALSSLVALVTVLATSAVAVDTRYVKAENLQEAQAQNVKEFSDIKRTIHLNELQADRRAIKQQIFTIKLKEKPSALDRAQLSDLTQDLDVINSKILQLSK